MIDEATIDKLLDMSRIDIRPDTRNKFIKQIKDIVLFVDQIGKVDTSLIENRESVFDTADRFRDDKIVHFFSQSDLRKYTNNLIDGYYAVPKIINKDDQ